MGIAPPGLKARKGQQSEALAGDGGWADTALLREMRIFTREMGVLHGERASRRPGQPDTRAPRIKPNPTCKLSSQLSETTTMRHVIWSERIVTEVPEHEEIEGSTKRKEDADEVRQTVGGE